MRKKNVTIDVYFEDLDGFRTVRAINPRIEDDYPEIKTIGNRLRVDVYIGGGWLTATYETFTSGGRWVVPSGAH